MRLFALTLLLCSTLLAQGCSSIIGATTDEPISSNPGKRTFGTLIDDQQIETMANVNLDKSDEGLKNAHISITSYNGVVLLTGQVENQSLRDQATTIVSDIKNVRQVHNELQVQGKTSLVARSNDTWLTSKVKTRLLANRDIAGSRIKVVTEDGVVYLMGLLSRVEAEKATEVASSTSGVQKVVRVFEYID